MTSTIVHWSKMLCLPQRQWGYSVVIWLHVSYEHKHISIYQWMRHEKKWSAKHLQYLQNAIVYLKKPWPCILYIDINTKILCMVHIRYVLIDCFNFLSVQLVLQLCFNRVENVEHLNYKFANAQEMLLLENKKYMKGLLDAINLYCC